MTVVTTGAGNLIVISAPSGAGKTSLVHALVQSEPSVTVSVSHTTRPRRAGERDGIDYHFVDDTAFRAMVDREEFVEYAEVFGNSYGTSKLEISTQIERGVDLVLEIDWQGARAIRAAFPAAVSVFILPPSESTLRERLLKRGDDPDVIERRMRSALGEISHFDEYEFLVVNDVFEQALDELRGVVRSCRLKTPLRQRHLAPGLAGLIASAKAI